MAELDRPAHESVDAQPPGAGSNEGIESATV